MDKIEPQTKKMKKEVKIGGQDQTRQVFHIMNNLFITTIGLVLYYTLRKEVFSVCEQKSWIHKNMFQSLDDRPSPLDQVLYWYRLLEEKKTSDVIQQV